MNQIQTSKKSALLQKMPLKHAIKLMMAATFAEQRRTRERAFTPEALQADLQAFHRQDFPLQDVRQYCQNKCQAVDSNSYLFTREMFEGKGDGNG